MTKTKKRLVKNYDLIKKIITSIGIGIATYGSIISNNTILLIGGALSVVGALMIVTLK